jgi:hypothetical protein
LFDELGQGGDILLGHDLLHHDGAHAAHVHLGEASLLAPLGSIQPNILDMKVFLTAGGCSLRRTLRPQR